jgi:hypothetical protein
MIASDGVAVSSGKLIGSGKHSFSLKASLSAAVTDGAHIYQGRHDAPDGREAAASFKLIAQSMTLPSGKDILEAVEAAKPPGPSKSTEAGITALMIGSGALVNLLGGFMYDFSPTNQDVGVVEILEDAWLTYLLTVGIFAFEGVCSGASRATRKELYDKCSYRFVRLLLIPSALDVLITGMATLALAFIRPAIVGVLKTTVQLLALAIISRIVLKKKQSTGQWLCRAPRQPC